MTTLLLALVPLLLWQQQRQANVALEAAKNEADANLDVAIRAVTDFLADTGGHNLARIPGARDLSLSLTTRAVEFFDELATRDDSERIRVARGLGRRWLANALDDLGRSEEARTAVLFAIDLLERTPSSTPDIALERGLARLLLLHIDARAGRGAELAVEAEATRADLDLAAVAPALLRSVAKARVDVLGTESKFAYDHGDPARARALVEHKILAITAARSEFGDDDEIRHSAAVAYHLAGMLWYDAEDLAAARGEFERAVAEAKAISPEHRGPTSRGDVLAFAVNGLAYVAIGDGDLDTAAARLRECVALRESELAADPLAPRLMHYLACDLSDLASVLANHHQAEAAMPHIERAIDLQRAVLQGQPEHTKAREFLDNHLLIRLHAATELRRPDAIVEAARACLELQTAARAAMAAEAVLEAGSRGVFGQPPSEAARRLALDLLAALLQRGWHASLPTNAPAFDWLRHDPEFTAISAAVDTLGRQGGR